VLFAVISLGLCAHKCAKKKTLAEVRERVFVRGQALWLFANLQRGWSRRGGGCKDGDPDFHRPAMCVRRRRLPPGLHAWLRDRVLRVRLHAPNCAAAPAAVPTRRVGNPYRHRRVRVTCACLVPAPGEDPARACSAS